jgi:abortive infection bacteriophage resistance protein
VQFTKPSQSIPQLIDLMRSRGLAIPDIAEATHYLEHIGYYRLSGYSLPLTLKHHPSSPSENFKPGTSFTDILNLYRFDRELRLLVMDAVERVEVSFRAVLSDTMSLKYGPHWYLQKKLFVRSKDCEELVQKIITEIGLESDGTLKEKSRDVFIEHYLLKYTDPLLPPSWMIAEVLSISSWSKIFHCLEAREDRKSISTHFGMNPEVLQSWIHCVSYTRNICAHHARLWNREFTIKPLIARGHEPHLQYNGRFYAQAYIINALLIRASPSSTWWTRFMAFLVNNPFIDKKALGFPI